MKKLYKPNVRIWVDKTCNGYVGDGDLIIGNVYLKQFGKFHVPYTEFESSVYLLVKADLLKIPDADYCAITQVPMIVWSADYMEPDWKRGLRWYIDKLNAYKINIERVY